MEKILAKAPKPGLLLMIPRQGHPNFLRQSKEHPGPASLYVSSPGLIATQREPLHPLDVTLSP